MTSGTQTTERACTLRVTALTVKDGNQFNYLPEAFAGSAYAHTLTALGAAGPVSWNATGPLPAGLALGANGLLAGTPTAAGTFFINLRVTDGVDAVFRSMTLRVSAVNIITGSVDGVLPNATQGQAYSATLTAAGGTPPYTFSGFAPAGLSLSPSGTISGTVSTSASPGPSPVSVTVTDSRGASSTRTLSLDVVGATAALPSIDLSTYNNLDDCTIGVRCSRGIAVRRGGTAPFTWTATGLPPGVSIRSSTGASTTIVSLGPGSGSLLTAGDGELWGVPTATGIYNVTLTVTDATGVSATQIYPLKVTELLQPGPLVSPTFNAAYSQIIRVVGGRQPYTAAKVSGELPAGVTLDPGTLLLSGTPVENGFFSLVFAFTDANNETYRAPESLFITGGGSTISIGNNRNLGSVAIGLPYSNQLSACCAASLAWSVVDGTLPPGLSLSAGGRLSGAATTPGTYTFLIRAADADQRRELRAAAIHAARRHRAGARDGDRGVAVREHVRRVREAARGHGRYRPAHVDAGLRQLPAAGTHARVERPAQRNGHRQRSVQLHRDRDR